MLYTTFEKAKEARACILPYKKMAKALGGINKYGKNTPLPLDKVLEVCGLNDAIWCFRCTTQSSDNIRIEFACRCAEHVLHFFEDKYPGDKRPRLAIEAARDCLMNKTTDWAAGDAWDAARAAAWAVEREWQRNTLLELLKEETDDK